VLWAADEQFRAAIARQDSIVLVKGPRQVGKTSLLGRGLHQARQAGAQVVQTDLQTLNAAHLESAETLLLALGESIAEQLDLEVMPADLWESRRGPSPNFRRYLRREVLAPLSVERSAFSVETDAAFVSPQGSTLNAQRSPHLVWGLDEVDRLFHCDFGSEIFGLFRSWHNERVLDPTGPMAQLTLAMAYATEAHLFITDVHQSPFNVGTRVVLEDFTRDQVADLNARYNSPLRDEADLARFYRLVGGHPYLVRCGLDALATQGADLTALEECTAAGGTIFGDHLRRLHTLLRRDPELCEAMRAVLRGQPCPTPESFYRLRSAGVLTGRAESEARPRCRLYAAYLERCLL
jgi:hypothetical protein